jgi:hypothetical protein
MAITWERLFLNFKYSVMQPILIVADIEP